MKRLVLLDTGPLVASLSRDDYHHEWASVQWHDIEPPLLTCEGVISEAGFLLDRVPGAKQAVFELLRRQIIVVPFLVSDHATTLAALLKKYSDVPMSVADACLVRMAEQFHETAVFTVDSDFRLYRKHGRRVIPRIIPKTV